MASIQEHFEAALSTCGDCGLGYDAQSAVVCSCISQHRSLVCPHCGSCSCGRPGVIDRGTPAGWRKLQELRQAEYRPQPVPRSEPRGLVVLADDDFSVRFLGRRMLERLGYSVVTASDGEEAWQAIVTHRPDVVILDALMPRLDGRELSRRIKTTDDTRSIRVAVMTALYKSRAQRAETLHDFLADAFMPKPIRPEIFEETVEQLAVPA